MIGSEVLFIFIVDWVGYCECSGNGVVEIKLICVVVSYLISSGIMINVIVWSKFSKC